MSSRGYRFLIVRLGSLGDIVHTIPVVAALREHHPGARIDWMVEPRYAELLGMIKGVDRKVVVDPRANLAALFETLRELRRRRYHVAFDVQGLLKSAVLARLAGARQTVGFTRPHLREPAARFFYTKRIDPGPVDHVIQKNLAQLRVLDIHVDRPAFPLSIRRTPVAGLIESQLGGLPFMVLNPGAAWENKRWPPERFGAVASTLRERTGLRALVLWGPKEERLAQQVASASDGAALVAPATTVNDVVAIASQARLMISGDTGPLHLAAAVGTPIVSIFGPTRSERNGPWSPADIAVSRFETCRCPYQRRCTQPSRCIDTITVGDVVDAAVRRLGS